MRHCLFAALVLLASIPTVASPREKTLYIFKGTDDGAEPRGGLINLAGNFFGTTYSGGANSYTGTVFQLSPPSTRGASWTETVLYDFPKFSTGINPWAGLTSDKAGNLYGTTWLGGSGADGVVFRLAPPRARGASWTYTILYNFKGGRRRRTTTSWRGFRPSWKPLRYDGGRRGIEPVHGRLRSRVQAEPVV